MVAQAKWRQRNGCCCSCLYELHEFGLHQQSKVLSIKLRSCSTASAPHEFTMAAAEQQIPVLLLKTKSSPIDAYEDHFSTRQDELDFVPAFIPVLEHRLDASGMTRLAVLLEDGKLAGDADSAYGGLVFASQRAVEAFAKLVTDGRGTGEPGWPHLQNTPIYSVGPATARALRAVPQEPSLQVFGEHTGNADKLAPFILEHYGHWYAERGQSPPPPLLLVVGEQRRDTIPKALMDASLPPERCIPVDEVVVYVTGVAESFGSEFKRALAATQSARLRWVVVFSPTGCDSMLSGLGMLDETTNQARPHLDGPTTVVATIGPTTRRYLQKTFGFEPQVCSEQPTPEALSAGIAKYTRRAIGAPH